MRRCSGREGVERGAEMSAVKMAGGVAPFYKVWEAVEGSGGGRPVRWVLIPVGFLKDLRGGGGDSTGFGLMREGGGTMHGLASHGATEGRGAQRRWPIERWCWR
jgi:hypothetical protein